MKAKKTKFKSTFKSTKKKNKVFKQPKFKQEDEEKIKNLLQCLEEGNLVPIKNYLRSKLPKKKSNKTTNSKQISEQFREENLSKETPSERTVKLLLRKLKVRFTRQQVVHYDKGKFYILDFYIPSQRLCIEIDGKYHEIEEQQKLDGVRTENLNKMGIEVVRYTNEETQDPLFESDLKMLLNIPIN